MSHHHDGLTVTGPYVSGPVTVSGGGTVCSIRIPWLAMERFSEELREAAAAHREAERRAETNR